MEWENRHIEKLTEKKKRREEGTYEVGQGGEGDEIVVRVRLDEQLG
jgi:hypothetical protein